MVGLSSLGINAWWSSSTKSISPIPTLLLYLRLFPQIPVATRYKKSMCLTKSNVIATLSWSQDSKKKSWSSRRSCQILSRKKRITETCWFNLPWKILLSKMACQTAKENAVIFVLKGFKRILKRKGRVKLALSWLVALTGRLSNLLKNLYAVSQQVSGKLST